MNKIICLKKDEREGNEKGIKVVLASSILRPSYSSPFISLSPLYFQQNQFSRALSFLQLAEQLHPTSPLIYYYIALENNNLKEYNKTIEYYEKSIELDPSNTHSHLL